MRRGRLVDRDREGDHVGPEGKSERAEGGGEDDGDDAERRLIATPLETRGQKERRDTELELRIRSMLGADLPVEADLARWFPMWDLPVA